MHCASRTPLHVSSSRHAFFASVKVFIRFDDCWHLKYLNALPKSSFGFSVTLALVALGVVTLGVVTLALVGLGFSVSLDLSAKRSTQEGKLEGAEKSSSVFGLHK